MSSATYAPPVSDGQRELLARLVRQGRVSLEQLQEAGVGQMDRRSLAAWIDANVLGTQVDVALLHQVEELFDPTG